jgi:hypothetical protein
LNAVVLTVRGRGEPVCAVRSHSFAIHGCIRLNGVGEWAGATVFYIFSTTLFELKRSFCIFQLQTKITLDLGNLLALKKIILI